MVFPGSDGAAAPSQPNLRSAARRTAGFFVIPLIAARLGALRRPGLLAGAFGVLDRLARIFCEFYRDPDPRLEDLGGGLTMGMLLSAPLIVIGVALIGWSVRMKSRRRADMSALGDQIKLKLAKGGAITVERFMELALADPQYGYYMTRDPFGTKATSPPRRKYRRCSASSSACGRRKCGRRWGVPNPVRLIELRTGPRHADERRPSRRARRPRVPRRARRHADRNQPAARPDPIRRAAHRRRADRLGGQLREAPDGPAIILANEFLDALPVRTVRAAQRQWRERLVASTAPASWRSGVADEPEPFSPRRPTTAT